MASTEGDDTAPDGAGKTSDPTRRKRLLVLHPILFALFPVLYLYANHIEESIPFEDLAEAMVPVVGITLGAWLIATVLMESIGRGGLAVSALVALFFIYGPVQARLEGTVPGRHGVLLPVWGVIGLLAVLLASRIRSRLREFTLLLNFLAAGLVVLNLLPVVTQQVRARVFGTDSAPDGPLVHSEGIPAPGEGSRPSVTHDIYYLVFDTYTDEDVLRDFFGHDNRAFLTELERRGFYVARDATANYPRSSVSIASSLNFDYLDFMTEWFGRKAGLEVYLHDLLQRSRSARFLQSQGYRYAHAGSFWRPTKRSPIADKNLEYGGLSEFTVALFRNTALRPYADENLHRRHEWARTRFQLESVKRLAADPEPTFTFAHIMLPHGPEVFNRDGTFVTDEQLAARTREESYVEQVLYANTRILDLLDTLLAGPRDEQPVVILQADEGPYHGDPARWPRPVRLSPDIERKFPILNAYYFPERDYDDLYQSITPVNSFRVLLNRFFGTDLPLLPDRNYVFRDYRLGLFDFTDVTTLVREATRS